MSFDYALAKQDGFTDQQIAEVLGEELDFNVGLAVEDGFSYSQIAQLLVEESESQDSGFFREALDVPVLAAQGATQLVRMGTQAFGADNPLAEGLMGVEDFLGSLISAGSRQQQEEIAQIFEEAEGQGVGEQVKAGLRALTVAPVDTIAQFGGTAVPFIAASVLTGGAATPALALGATTGAGLVKGTIFDAVEREYIAAGVDPEQAREIAEQAQAYTGDNVDQIALGGVLGAAAGRLGIEKGITNLITRKVGEEAALPVGIKTIVGGAVAESVPEAIQAGQEKFADNIARQREGFDVDLMEGVVGQSVFEGGAGLVLGGGVGVTTSRRNRLNNERQAEILRKKQEEEEALERQAEEARQNEEAALQSALGEVLDPDLDTTDLPDDFAAVAVDPDVSQTEPLLPARELDVRDIQPEAETIIRRTNPDEELTFVSEPTADGRGFQIIGSDQKAYGAPITEAETARQLALRLNQTKKDQRAVRDANNSVNDSGLSKESPSTLRNFLSIGNRVLNPRFNEVTAAEINYAADANTDESILTDRRRRAIEKLPLDQAEYYLTKSAPANRAKSNAEKMRLLTPTQRENIKRRDKGLPEKSTFTMAEARRILGKDFGNLANPQPDIAPDVEYLASISSTSIPISRREQGSPKKAKTLLKQGVYKFAEGAPKQVSLEKLNELLEQKNIISSIRSKELQPLIKAFTGAGSYRTMKGGDRRVLYQKINQFADFAEPTKLPLYKGTGSLQVTQDTDIVTPDTGDLESETSKQRAEFIKDFRRKQTARPYAESEAGRGESAYIRRSYGRESGPYTRKISQDDGRDGLLDLDPSQNAQQYQNTGLSLPQVFEVDAELEAENYYNDMVAAMAGHEFAAQVEIKDPTELSKYRLYRTADGSGFAIKPDGDIVAVFASASEPKGGSYALLQAAVQAGGKKLDAFNTYLPKIYSRVGFRPVARLPWNDEFAPPNWDKQTFSEFNNGEPEIYFFTYDPFYYGEATEVPLVQDYDDAVRLQDQALESPLALPSPQPDQSVQPEPPPPSSAVAADESKVRPTTPELTPSQAGRDIADAQVAALKYLTENGMSKGNAEVVANQAGGAAGSVAVNETEQTPTQSGGWDKVKGRFDRLIFNIQDKFLDLKRVEQGIAESVGIDSLPTLESAYDGIESITGKVGNEFRKLQDKVIRPLLEKLNARGITRQELNDFLILRHAIERNDFVRKRNEANKGKDAYNPDLKDGGTGTLNGNRLTDAYVKDVMQKEFGLQWDNTAGDWVGGNALARDMLDVAADFDAINQASLEDELKYGLISQKEFDELADKFKYYVPMRGRAENPETPLSLKEEVDQNIGRRTSVNNLSTKGKEGQRIRGRTGTQAFDPLANAYAARQSTIVRGIKNQQFGQRLFNLINNNPNPDYWEILEVGESIPDGQTAIGYKQDGVQRNMIIYDKRLRDALLGMDAQSGNAILQVFRGLNRFLSAVNTSYNPEFVISNFTRDLQTALANIIGEESMKGGKAVDIKGLKKAILKDTLPSVGQVLNGLRDNGKLDKETQEAWDTYLESGAKTDFFYARSPAETAKDIASMDEMVTGTFKGSAKQSFDAFTGLVGDLNGAVENGVRFAVFKQARKSLMDANVPVQEANARAATLAKNLTVNFNRKGNSGELLNAAYLFFNASVQGTANFARGLTSPRKLGMVTAMTGIGALITYLNEMHSEEEDESGRSLYDNIPDYEKERNIILMKDVFEPVAEFLGLPFEKTAERYYKIPLPYGYNVFHLIGVNLAEMDLGQKSQQEAVADLTSAAIGSFSPLGFANSDDATLMLFKGAMPQAGKPFLETVVNENYFGSPIYREDFPGATPTPDSSRAMLGTPQWVKNAATFLNEFSGGNPQQSGGIDISPDVSNHLLNSFTGGTGVFLNRLSEYQRKLRNGEEIELREIPFVRRIKGEADLRESQSDYYDRRDDIRQAVARVDALRGPERVKFRTDNIDILRMNSQMKSTDRRIRSLNTRLTEVREKLLEATDISLRLRLQDTEEKLQEQKDQAIARFNRRFDQTVGRTE